MSPAISFNGEWLDKLLSGSKQQTTRKPTDRIKVGDICNIYNQQRRRITDKPLRKLTDEGHGQMVDLAYRSKRERPIVPLFATSVREYHAHVLGKVEIIEVYYMCPCECSERNRWAKLDGFDNFACADTWFTRRYGGDWYIQDWTVIRWDVWTERYFEPATVD